MAVRVTSSCAALPTVSTTICTRLPLRRINPRASVRTGKASPGPPQRSGGQGLIVTVLAPAVVDPLVIVAGVVNVLPVVP